MRLVPKLGFRGLNPQNSCRLKNPPEAGFLESAESSQKFQQRSTPFRKFTKNRQDPAKKSFLPNLRIPLCQSQQPPSPDGKPHGFVRYEYDGFAGYCIGEFVDRKLHGHHVTYGPAGDVLGEDDWLLGEFQ